jgi:hypothetical protein
MRNKLSRVISVFLCAALVLSMLSGCGSTNTEDTSGQQADTSTDAASESAETTGKTGTIMLLSTLTDGAQYEALKTYTTDILSALGYTLTIVYGDLSNDPAGNLKAVKNGMTSDVVGLITMQDGGIKDIMTEYPELKVVGYNADLRSVFDPGRENNEVAENPNFLGTICDGHYDGVLSGKDNFEIVKSKGYKKVSIITFPEYAFPFLVTAANTFREEVDNYNTTAADGDKIEIVGETKVLEFAPLEESYFLEPGNDDLDCIVCFCAGILFVYPTVKSAISNGLCSPDTKIITGGFDTDPSITADIGGDGIMQSVTFSPLEDIVWSIVMLDNAIQGKQFPDFTKPEVIDALSCVVDSKEDIENVLTKSVSGTLKTEDAALSVDDVKNLTVRFNPDATYAGLNETIHSDLLSVEALANK